jgi:hypothetical protein
MATGNGGGDDGGGGTREAANRAAFERLSGADPVLVDVSRPSTWCRAWPAKPS